MYFKFECSNCGKSLKISDEHVGRKTRCPYCNTSQVVPEPPREEPAAAPVAATGKSELKGAAAGPGTTAAKPPATGGAPRGGEGKEKEAVSGTDVSTLKSLAIALVLTALFYAMVYPLGALIPEPVKAPAGVEMVTPPAGGESAELPAAPAAATTPAVEYSRAEKLGDRFYDLFYNRGWVTVAETVFMFFCFAVLFLKWRKIRRQRQSMLFDMLPTEIGEDINESNVTKFTDHLQSLPIDSSQSFLLNRVRRGLEHYRVRRSASEVTTMLASQSDIDGNEVDASYILVNAALWAIPILGFIGTVIGISQSVGQLSATMENAADISALKDSLKGMTGGLSTAFDTTLVGLVMSVGVMFTVKPLQKAEEALLNWVSEYCNENLIKRLKDAGASTEQEVGHPDNLKAMRHVIDAAMADHHAELETWTKKLEQIGIALTQQAAKGWGEIHKQMADELKAKESAINESMSGVGERQATLLEKIDEIQTRVVKVQEEQIKASVEAEGKWQTMRQSDLETWTKKLEQIGIALTQQAAKGWGEIHKQLVEEHKVKEKDLGEVMSGAAERQAALLDRIEELQGRVVKLQEEQMKSAMESDVKRQELRDDASRSMVAASDALRKHVDGMDQALRALNETLTALGTKQITIETVVPVEKGWSLFGGKKRK